MSLRWRVLAGCAAVALVLLLADVALASTFRSFLVGRVDDQLAAATDRLIRVEGPRRPGLRGRVPPGSTVVDARGFTEYYLAATNADGTAPTIIGPVNRLRDLEPPDVEAGDVVEHAVSVGESVRPFTSSAPGGGQWRMAAVRAADGSVLLAGLPLGDVQATLGRMVAVLVLATLAVLLTLAGVAWWVLRQGVRPLVAMTATAGAIAAGDLSERVTDVDERTEAGALGAALNTMLGTIESSFAQRVAVEERLRRFVADASHELRTPLTSIRGYAELYRQGALADPTALADAMRRVEGEAARMGGLVDDLLLLARLDQGRALEQVALRLDEVAADAVADAHAVDPSRTITLTSEPAVVLGDEARLRQVAANLLGNALVHTPTGTPVHVSVETADGSVRLRVRDEGPGMDADVAQRAFERFYRADTARGMADRGSGLGLAIVESVIAAHGGSASLTSELGVGTEVTVVLPMPLQPTMGQS